MLISTQISIFDVLQLIYHTRKKWTYNLATETSVNERPYINITNLIWSFDHDSNCVNLLLVKRSEWPFENRWALPETFLRSNEDADESALRLVKDKIGLELADFHTEQLATFTHQTRYPGSRSLSLSYMTFLPDMPKLDPGYGTTDARWFAMSFNESQYLFSNGDQQFATAADTNHDEYYAKLDANQLADNQLAFDHSWILKVACDRIKNKLDYQPNILLMLGTSFTLKSARRVYAAFLKKDVNQIDNSNFKKNHKHLFVEVGITTSNRPGRPARKYQLAYLPA